MGRKKFDRYLLRDERERLLATFWQEALLIEISGQIHVCCDHRDNKFLELAVSGEADGLVSGDDDLLQLGVFREIPIITPGQFLSLFGSPSPKA